MANQRLSQLAPTNTVNTDDDFYVAVSGVSNRIAGQTLATQLAALANVEAGAEVNRLLNIGLGTPGAVSIHPPDATTDGRPHLKSLLAGTGITIQDDNANLTITATGGYQARTVNEEAGTTYQFKQSDAGRYIRFTAATAVSAEIPLDATYNFAVGTEIHGEQAGAGALTISKEAGVTLNHAGSGTNPSMRQQFSGFTIIKTAADTWTCHGDLATT